MKLYKHTRQDDIDGSFNSELIAESDDIYQLKKKGLELAENSGHPDANWFSDPPIAGTTIKRYRLSWPEDNQSESYYEKVILIIE